MIDSIGVIGGILFFVKIVLHLYLSQKTDDLISLRSVGHFSPPQLFIHYYKDVPQGYRWLKTTVNAIYAFFVLCLAIFLIGVNIK